MTPEISDLRSPDLSVPVFLEKWSKNGKNRQKWPFTTCSSGVFVGLTDQNNEYLTRMGGKARFRHCTWSLSVCKRIQCAVGARRT